MLPASEATTEMEDANHSNSSQPQSSGRTIIAFNRMSMNDLLKMVAAMLNEIVTINDRIVSNQAFNESKLTRFHSREAPSISIKDYLLRIIRFCSLDPAILLVLVYFIDLLSQRFENFVLNSLTVHRFLITSVTVASKGLCDSFCTNSYYAKVGGLQQMELNMLEVEFLTRVGYRIVPDVNVLNDLYNSMFIRHAPVGTEARGRTNRPRSLNKQDLQSTITAPQPTQDLQQSHSGSQNHERASEPPIATQLNTPMRSSSTDSAPVSQCEAEGSERIASHGHKLSRAVKNMFNPMKKRGSEGAIVASTKRSKQ